MGDDLRSLIAAAAAGKEPWALFVLHDSGRIELHTADGDPTFVLRVEEARREVVDRLLLAHDATCVEARQAGLELVAVCSRCQFA